MRDRRIVNPGERPGSASGTSVRSAAMLSLARSGYMRAAGRGVVAGALLGGVAASAHIGSTLQLFGPAVDVVISAGLFACTIAMAWAALRMVAAAAAVVRRATASRPAAYHFASRIESALASLATPGVAAGTTMAAILWVSPVVARNSLFALFFPYEIPIVTGALVCGVASAGLAAWRTQPPTLRTRAPAVALYALALAIGTAVGVFVVGPGWGRPDTANDPVSLASVPLLDLPDPSQRGPYTVVAAAYGSGNELRRPELGQDVLWRTAVVDASGVLPRRGFLARSYAAWLWGFDDAHIPVHGLVWYPAEPDGPLPLVLIAHGNRVSSAYSERGYAYLGEHLASHGMIAVSVDENYLNGDALFDYRGEEYPLRAWLLLRHVDQFRMWNDLPDHPLSGRVDLDRVALIGHSRGGEAAALAAEFAAGRTPPAGLPPSPPGISVRAVIGIAPTEGQFRGAPIRLTDVDYLVIQGAHDAELPAFWGLATYHRVQFTGADRRIKVALLSQRANHGRFNSVWNDADAGLASWMLDRVSILSPAEQQQLTRAVVLAFLRRSLFDDRAYDAFFREPRSGRHWLPDDVILSHWETSDRIDIADFDVGGLITRTFDASGFDVAILRDPELRDRTFQGDLALYLRWSRPATVQVNLDPGTSARVDPAGRLTLSIFADSGGSLPDPVVEVRAGGESAAVRLGTVVPFRPLPRPRVWKNDTLAKRYVREAPPPGVVERFLQTYAIELSHFTAVNPDLDLTALEAVLLHFDGAGSAFLDDLGFEPAD